MLSGNRKVLFLPSPHLLPLASRLSWSHPSAVFHFFIASTFTQFVQFFFFPFLTSILFSTPHLKKNSIPLSALYFVSSSSFPLRCIQSSFSPFVYFQNSNLVEGEVSTPPTSPQRLPLCAAGKLCFYHGSFFFFSHMCTHTCKFRRSWATP